MRITILPAIIVNIVSVIVLLIGFFHKFEKPKNKAVFGYFIVGSLFMYIAILSLTAIYEFIAKNNLYGFILFLCTISPFVIGKFVKYKTLKKYTIAQILCFIVSLAILIFEFK